MKQNKVCPKCGAVDMNDYSGDDWKGVLPSCPDCGYIYNQRKAAQQMREEQKDWEEVLQ